MLLTMDGYSVDAFTKIEGDIQSLATQARSESFSFIDRLLDDWRDGSNRFDGKGECFLQLMVAETLVAVGGINRDPYSTESNIGRIRHVYVRPEFRRSGVGRVLLDALLERATHFKRLRLRANDERAFRFYESLGFVPSNEPNATHTLDGPFEK